MCCTILALRNPVQARQATRLASRASLCPTTVGSISRLPVSPVPVAKARGHQLDCRPRAVYLLSWHFPPAGNNIRRLICGAKWDLPGASRNARVLLRMEYMSFRYLACEKESPRPRRSAHASRGVPPVSCPPLPHGTLCYVHAPFMPWEGAEALGLRLEVAATACLSETCRPRIPPTPCHTRRTGRTIITSGLLCPLPARGGPSPWGSEYQTNKRCHVMFRLRCWAVSSCLSDMQICLRGTVTLDL